MAPITRRGERGQVLPLVALLLVALGMGAALIGRTAEAAVATARARTAADLAALAGAAAGHGSAARVAAANGATLVDYDRDGLEVTVRVRRGDRTARATARRQGDAGTTTGGLAPALRAALARAGQLLGVPVPITSGYRTREQQAALHARRGANPYPVAPPGTSRHEQGLAVDVPLSFVPRLLAVAPMAGLCRPYPTADPVHFELCPPR